MAAHTGPAELQACLLAWGGRTPLDLLQLPQILGWGCVQKHNFCRAPSWNVGLETARDKRGCQFISTGSRSALLALTLCPAFLPKHPLRPTGPAPRRGPAPAGAGRSWLKPARSPPPQGTGAGPEQMGSHTAWSSGCPHCCSCFYWGSSRAPYFSNSASSLHLKQKTK